ncbi:histidine kinase, partial [filamentous cyanobacterium CCP5]
MSVGGFELLETLSYRGLFQLRGPVAWDDRIVLIAIDDATLAELGQFPLPRDVYAQLVEQLAASEPAAIALNFIFAEPTQADGALAEAMEQQGNVVLPVGLDDQARPLTPTLQLEVAALSTGHILKDLEADGLVHKVRSVAIQQTALGITLIEAYGLRQSLVPLPPLELPLWVNWPGPAASLTQYSLADVLAQPPGAGAFKNKIVLVGMTATGTDALPTPYDFDPPASGVLLQAAIVDSLLQQRYLHPMNSVWLWGLLLLAMPLESYLLTGRRLRWQLLVPVACMAGWLTMSATAFVRANYLWPTAVPMVLVGFTGGATLVSQRVRENLALQRLLDDLWQH